MKWAFKRAARLLRNARKSRRWRAGLARPRTALPNDLAVRALELREKHGWGAVRISRQLTFEAKRPITRGLIDSVLQGRTFKELVK